MLNSDFRDILSAFSEEKVEFMLVGAYAVAAHGLPRATGDIDLWIKCSPTASVLNAALLAIDHDFDHLSSVFLDVIDIDQKLTSSGQR